MDARDQRERQQFHEARIFDAVQAPVFTGSIDAVPLRAPIENIEIGASRKVPKATAQDDRAATGVLRQVRGTSIHKKPRSGSRCYEDGLSRYFGGPESKRWSCHYAND
jgi:hypothetical protein